MKNHANCGQLVRTEKSRWVVPFCIESSSRIDVQWIHVCGIFPFVEYYATSYRKCLVILKKSKHTCWLLFIRPYMYFASENKLDFVAESSNIPIPFSEACKWMKYSVLMRHSWRDFSFFLNRITINYPNRTSTVDSVSRKNSSTDPWKDKQVEMSI